MIIEKVKDEYVGRRKDVYSVTDFSDDDMDWANFSAAKKGSFQPKYPTFDLLIPDDFADELREKGVHVKINTSKRKGESAYAINIKINFDYPDPPEVYIRGKHGEKEYFNADTIHTFDSKWRRFTNGKLMFSLNFSEGYEGTCYANILEFMERKNPFDEEWPDDYPGEDEGAELPFR